MEALVQNTKPSIFEYDDYRKYLNDLYHYYKKETAYFSYRYFSNRAGFKSPNFLKLVIDDNRNLTEDSIQKTIKAFCMSKSEAEFFRNLVLFCQAKSMTKKLFFAKGMARLKVSSKTYSLKQAQLKYYSNWYYIPLRELIRTPGFKEDIPWIREQFNGELKSREITEAIKDLIELGLVFRNQDDLLVATHDNVAGAQDILSSTSVVNYHIDMIGKGAESIAQFESKDREISTTCISCSEDLIQDLKPLLRDFRKDVLAMAQKDKKADKIYQLNFQLFPITGVKKRGTE